MKYVSHYIFIIVLLGSFACSKQKQESQIKEVNMIELPLPMPPSTLESPMEKAAYMVNHFWDEMNFQDTLRSHDTDFMEQNFSNYVSLFPYTEKEDINSGVGILLKKAQKDSIAYYMLLDIADKYLYDPNSPMYDEEFYLPFVEQGIVNHFTSDTMREKLEFRKETIMKNRQGTVATDFSFITRNGNKETLHGLKSEGNILLIFYDPDCETCQKVLEELSNDEVLGQMINEGEFSVVAIYSGEDQQLWKTQASKYPAEWIVGYDNGKIEDDDLYILRASPTLYILDKDKTVVYKDILPDQFFYLLHSQG